MYNRLVTRDRVAPDPDAARDGRYFIGVVTTGVYCRPRCSGRPLERNTRLFPSAAAAEAFGFRPCLRCHPERAAPLTGWTCASPVVARALELISDGTLDSNDLDALAARLGVSSRHLRRLFVEHLGASPAAVASARRTHFARALLDETDLSVAEVAFAAGFGSVRQFNHAIRTTFRRTPTELRAMRSRRALRSSGGGVVFRLPYRPPLDWPSLACFLAARAIPDVEAIDETGYRRLIVAGDEPAMVEVTPDPAGSWMVLRVHGARHARLIDLARRARRLFDLDADPAAVAGVLEADPRLAPLVRRDRLRVPGAWSAFETAVRILCGQQVSVAAASLAAGRIAEAFGKPVEGFEADGLLRLFPDAVTLAAAEPAGLPMPRARAEAIVALARAVADGTLSLEAGADLDELVASLRRLPGVGEWTAQQLAMRVAKHPDAFPAGDLGLRRAMRCLALDPSAAEAWRPWRAYAFVTLLGHDAPVGG